MKLNLDKNDITLLNKLLEISKKILKIYNNLYNLEINNQLNSLEYKKQLGYLTICKEIEDELYKQINYSKISDYIEYSDRANLFKDFSDYDLILDDFNDLLFAKRVYNRLHDLNTSRLVNIYQEELLNKTDEPPFDHSIYVTTSIHDDIENLLIYLTSNYNNRTYKDKLIKVKYLISYFNSRIELTNLNNLFINDKLFLQSKLTCDNLNFHDKSYKRLLRIYYLKYIKLHIKELDTINDELRNIILECLINSYSFLSQEKLDLDIKYNINEINSSNNIILLRCEKLVLNDEVNKKKMI
ncbi:MAG: hypothetical protein IJ501_02040 [Bacilli bacterium]|nr:hypothetical protein [Bacilli bacterium]